MDRQLKKLHKSSMLPDTTGYGVTAIFLAHYSSKPLVIYGCHIAFNRNYLFFTAEDNAIQLMFPCL